MLDSGNTYGWFVRLSKGPIGPITIRDVYGRRTTVYPDEFVFGECSYMQGMNGFVYLPNFNRNGLSESQLKYIRVDQPRGFDQLHMNPGTLADFQNLNVVDMNDLNDEDEYEECESEDVGWADEEDSFDEEEVLTFKPDVLLRYKDASNKDWLKMKKQEAKDILLESGVSVDGIDNMHKWDLIKHIKKLIKEIRNG